MDGKDRPKRIGERLVIPLGLLLLPGCLTLGAGHGKSDVASLGPVTQVHSAWDNQIVVTADVVHQGASLPGLAGRLYLFGDDPGHPVKGNGKVIVDLFDVGQRGPDGQAKMLERWVFDKETLNRLFRKDIIGWGYTLFLPWPDYRPEIERVRLKVCYQPEKGTPMFGPETQVSLRHKESPPVKVTEKAVPVGQSSPPIQEPNWKPSREAPKHSEEAGPAQASPAPSQAKN